MFFLGADRPSPSRWRPAFAAGDPGSGRTYVVGDARGRVRPAGTIDGDVFRRCRLLRSRDCGYLQQPRGRGSRESLWVRGRVARCWAVRSRASRGVCMEGVGAAVRLDAPHLSSSNFDGGGGPVWPTHQNILQFVVPP